MIVSTTRTTWTTCSWELPIAWGPSDPRPSFWHIWIYKYCIYVLTFFLASFLTFFLAFYLAFVICSDIIILSGILSDISHMFWYSIWQSFCAFYLTLFLTFFLAFYLAFSLACARGQTWPTASRAGDMKFGSRQGPLHAELVVKI
jgi:hypothetical protein